MMGIIAISVSFRTTKVAHRKHEWGNDSTNENPSRSISLLLSLSISPCIYLCQGKGEDKTTQSSTQNDRHLNTFDEVLLWSKRTGQLQSRAKEWS